MFKKLYEKLDTAYEFAKGNFIKQSNEHYDTRSVVRKESEDIKTKFDKMERVVTSQQRTIEQLTNALKDKYEHGLFVLSEDCKTPMVIRNGKEILNGRTTYFRITWAVGEAPTIETEQFVGTISGEDD